MTTILCVEDEITLCEDISEELEEAGYKVLQAHSGREGLYMILRHKPDMVISDITMPDMSGHELLAELRDKHPEVSSVPFLFLSALSNRRDVIFGIKLGADDYLTKPVDFEMLLTKVEAALRQTQRVAKHSDLAISKFLKLMDETDNVNTLTDILIDHLSKYGCEYIFIGGPPMPGKSIESMSLARKWPEGAWEHYNNNNFITADPVLWYGLKTQAPFHWSKASLVKGRESSSKLVLESAARYGMKEGYVVPIVAHDGAQLIASFSGKHISVPKSDYMAVSIVVHYAFNRLNILRGKELKRPGELSTREREVVQWTAFGKTSKDIAEILNITPRTVIMHLQNAGQKLNSVNRANTVAEAIRYRQVNF